MRNTISNPKHKRRCEYTENKRLIQLEAVYNALYKTPMTMKETDVVTGIMRESICRYISTLRDSGRVAVLGERICTVTKHLANIYTTNPDLVPAPQPNLFNY